MQYKIIRKNIKRIVIRFDKNGKIRVSAPYFIKDSNIHNFVESKKEWIEEKQKNIQKYDDNAKIIFFDKTYILKLIESNFNKIIEYDNTLEVYLKDLKNIKQIKKLILKWYEDKSKDIIQNIINKYINKIGRKADKIKLREMTTRWGSCNYKKANITLNTTLFRKPKICFEYVLLHELIHLIHPNHGDEFYFTLKSLMSNYKEIDKILKS